jgi:hypothetical protein
MPALPTDSSLPPFSFPTQNISNLAWAFGCLGLQHAPLFAALGAAAKGSHLEHFNHQNMTDFIWGAVAAGHQVCVEIECFLEHWFCRHTLVGLPHSDRPATAVKHTQTCTRLLCLSPMSPPNRTRSCLS